MVSPENTNWLYDYGVIEDIVLPDKNLSIPISPFTWPVHALDSSSNLSTGIDYSFGGLDTQKETGSRKRKRSAESCSASSSKANREKERRNRLNDKFMELSSILEPGRAAKTDKVAILIDAVRAVSHLRNEAHKLKDSNCDLHEKIKELELEKKELRDEKQRLKSEKEKLEQQLKSTIGVLPPAFIPSAAYGQGQVGPNKLVPFVSYPSVAMWQFMPPSAVDTSQDHILRPPVA